MESFGTLSTAGEFNRYISQKKGFGIVVGHIKYPITTFKEEITQAKIEM